jgi:beta-lactamase class A
MVHEEEIVQHFNCPDSLYIYEKQRMNIARKILFILIAFVLMPHMASSQPGLREKIQTVIDTSKAKIGVGILGLDFKDSLVINNDTHYPMLSVYKSPLAIMILHQVDIGKLSLEQNIHITREELDTNTWSPIARDFPNQDVDMKLSDLLIYTVSKSDNNGCDVLFSLAGGTAAVEKYIHDLGVKDLAIKATEEEMGGKWKVQYRNWCKPSAMLQLLQILYEGKVLSKSSNDFLMKAMIESSNSPARLKGLLPAGTIVAHKTGTSNTNNKGMKAATNDAGIVTTANARHYAIVVYVSDYPGGTARGEHMIAEISKIVFDHYAGK